MTLVTHIYLGHHLCSPSQLSVTAQCSAPLQLRLTAQPHCSASPLSSKGDRIQPPPAHKRTEDSPRQLKRGTKTANESSKADRTQPHAAQKVTTNNQLQIKKGLTANSSSQRDPRQTTPTQKWTEDSQLQLKSGPNTANDSQLQL